MSLSGPGTPWGEGMWKERPEKAKPGTLCLMESVRAMLMIAGEMKEEWMGLEFRCPLRSLWL